MLVRNWGGGSLTIEGRSQHLSLLVQPRLQTISNIWSWNCGEEAKEGTRGQSIQDHQLSCSGREAVHVTLHLSDDVTLLVQRFQVFSSHVTQLS